MINKSNILNFTDRLILHFYQNYCLKRKIGYHPLPWLSISKSDRSSGCYERLNTLFEFLKTSKIDGGVVLDVGCNIGFFSLSLKERGFFVYGVDENKFDLTIADTVGRSIKKGKFFSVNMFIDEKTVEYLPSADICLCLSIWHHWVKQHGLKNATTILKSLYKKTNKVLFFETAEKSKTGNDFSTNEYLVKTLGRNHVLWLGKSSPPQTAQNEIYKRELFAIIKKC